MKHPVGRDAVSACRDLSSRESSRLNLYTSMKTKSCAVCNRNLSQWRDGWPEWECSHISCPHRPHAWSDSSNHGCEQFEELPEPEPTIERLFDQP